VLLGQGDEIGQPARPLRSESGRPDNAFVAARSRPARAGNRVRRSRAHGSRLRCVCAAIPLAEPLRRAHHWVNPPRMSRPHHHLQMSASCAGFCRRIFNIITRPEHISPPRRSVKVTPRIDRCVHSSCGKDSACRIPGRSARASTKSARRGEPAVDQDLGCRDVARLVRDEEQNRVRDIRVATDSLLRIRDSG
jgi:hypothetical protein